MDENTQNAVTLVAPTDLTEVQKNRIQEIKNTIDITNPQSVSGFDTKAIVTIRDFTSRVLESTQLKEMPEVDQLLGGLIKELQTLDVNDMGRQPTFLEKLFKKGKNAVADFQLQYETVKDVIDKVALQLEDAKYTISKDVNLMVEYLQLLKKYIEELDIYIFAGEEKIKEEKLSLQIDRERLGGTVDSLVAQEFRQRESNIKRLERKVYNSFLVREATCQRREQIAFTMECGYAISEKITTTITNIIPLWEDGITVAITQTKQQNALALTEKVDDTQNKLMLQNAERMKSIGISVAKTLEKGVIDIETLKSTQNTLIETLSEIRKIQKDGEIARETNKKELLAMRDKLEIPEVTGGR